MTTKAGLKGKIQDLELSLTKAVSALVKLEKRFVSAAETWISVDIVRNHEIGELKNRISALENTVGPQSLYTANPTEVLENTLVKDQRYFHEKLEQIANILLKHAKKFSQVDNELKRVSENIDKLVPKSVKQENLSEEDPPFLDLMRELFSSMFPSPAQEIKQQEEIDISKFQPMSYKDFFDKYPYVKNVCTLIENFRHLPDGTPKTELCQLFPKWLDTIRLYRSDTVTITVQLAKEYNQTVVYLRVFDSVINQRS